MIEPTKRSLPWLWRSPKVSLRWAFFGGTASMVLAFVIMAVIGGSLGLILRRLLGDHDFATLPFVYVAALVFSPLLVGMMILPVAALLIARTAGLVSVLMAHLGLIVFIYTAGDSHGRHSFPSLGFFQSAFFMYTTLLPYPVVSWWLFWRAHGTPDPSDSQKTQSVSETSNVE